MKLVIMRGEGRSCIPGDKALATTAVDGINSVRCAAGLLLRILPHIIDRPSVRPSLLPIPPSTALDVAGRSAFGRVVGLGLYVFSLHAFQFPYAVHGGELAKSL